METVAMGGMPIANPICTGDRIHVYDHAVPPCEPLTVQMKADRNGDGKISPDEFPRWRLRGRMRECFLRMCTGRTPLGHRPDLDVYPVIKTRTLFGDFQRFLDVIHRQQEI